MSICDGALRPSLRRRTSCSTPVIPTACAGYRATGGIGRMLLAGYPAEEALHRGGYLHLKHNALCLIVPYCLRPSNFVGRVVIQTKSA